MNTSVTAFIFEGSAVRTVMREGEPWFVGKDVAERLGYTNPSKALTDHCRGVTIRYPIVDALGRDQEARVINEPDVLRLIMGSKLPAAERFERWVFEEVLPAIRKTGGYVAAAPDEPAEVVIARGLLAANAALERVTAQLAVVAPKAEALDLIATAQTGSLCLSDAAKTLGMKPRAGIAWLHQNRYVFRRPGNKAWVGYQDKIDEGLIEPKVFRDEERNAVHEQALITPKGLARLAALVKKQRGVGRSVN